MSHKNASVPGSLIFLGVFILLSLGVSLGVAMFLLGLVR